MNEKEKEISKLKILNCHSTFCSSVDMEKLSVSLSWSSVVFKSLIYCFSALHFWEIQYFSKKKKQTVSQKQNKS
jgi:hypothetical protein